LRGDAVVDITIDPIAASADRRRAVLRIGVPVFGVVLMIAVILVIAVYADSADRRGALALSDDVLTALDARIAGQVTQYFGTPGRALAIGEDLTGVVPPGELRR